MSVYVCGHSSYVMLVVCGVCVSLSLCVCVCVRESLCE